MTVKIALDAMGGDNGASAVIGGIARYLLSLSSLSDDDSSVFFNIYGDRDTIEGEIGKYSVITEDLYAIHHTLSVISSDMKPSYALRSGRGSSMFESIMSVANGDSDAVVSSGNTGAYMALSKVIMKTIDYIDRPALVSMLPNIDGGKNVVLDLGANTECTSENLLQFAMMGDAVAKCLLNLDKPKIGLLNVGTEKSKGTDSIREAYESLSSSNILNFIGFVEGTDLCRSTADVIVMDGFSGNIALKTIEGTIRLVAGLYEKNVRASLRGKISYLFSKKVLKNIKNVIDPREHNGASLVGLNGVAIKSHGNSDDVGFASAISVAAQLSKFDLIKKVKNSMKGIS